MAVGGRLLHIREQVFLFCSQIFPQFPLPVLPRLFPIQGLVLFLLLEVALPDLFIALDVRVPDLLIDIHPSLRDDRLHLRR